MKPDKLTCYAEMDGDLDPKSLFVEVGLLIMETRAQAKTAQSRIERPHLGIDTDRCNVWSRDTDQGKDASITLRQLDLLWRNMIPLCIDVIIFPFCKHGADEAGRGVTCQPLPSDEGLLLERWEVRFLLKRFSEKREGNGISGRGVVQALKSYLHFSQLSSWLNSTSGQLPLIPVYRIYSPGETVGLNFTQPPDVHTFPIAEIRQHVCHISVSSLPRINAIPQLICKFPDKPTNTDQPEASFLDETETRFSKKVPRQNVSVKFTPRCQACEGVVNYVLTDSPSTTNYSYKMQNDPKLFSSVESPVRPAHPTSSYSSVTSGARPKVKPLSLDDDCSEFYKTGDGVTPLKKHYSLTQKSPKVLFTSAAGLATEFSRRRCLDFGSTSCSLDETDEFISTVVHNSNLSRSLKHRCDKKLFDTSGGTDSLTPSGFFNSKPKSSSSCLITATSQGNSKKSIECGSSRKGLNVNEAKSRDSVKESFGSSDVSKASAKICANESSKASGPRNSLKVKPNDDAKAHSGDGSTIRFKMKPKDAAKERYGDAVSSNGLKVNPKCGAKAHSRGDGPTNVFKMKPKGGANESSGDNAPSSEMKVMLESGAKESSGDDASSNGMEVMLKSGAKESGAKESSGDDAPSNGMEVMLKSGAKESGAKESSGDDGSSSRLEVKPKAGAKDSSEAYGLQNGVADKPNNGPANPVSSIDSGRINRISNTNDCPQIAQDLRLATSFSNSDTENLQECTESKLSMPEKCTTYVDNYLKPNLLQAVTGDTNPCEAIILQNCAFSSDCNGQLNNQRSPHGVEVCKNHSLTINSNICDTITLEDAIGKNVIGECPKHFLIDQEVDFSSICIRDRDVLFNMELHKEVIERAKSIKIVKDVGMVQCVGGCPTSNVFHDETVNDASLTNDAKGHTDCSAECVVNECPTSKSVFPSNDETKLNAEKEREVNMINDAEGTRNQTDLLISEGLDTSACDAGQKAFDKCFSLYFTPSDCDFTRSHFKESQNGDVTSEKVKLSCQSKVDLNLIDSSSFYDNVNGNISMDREHGFSRDDQTEWFHDAFSTSSNIEDCFFDQNIDVESFSCDAPPSVTLRTGGTNYNTSRNIQNGVGTPEAARTAEVDLNSPNEIPAINVAKRLSLPSIPSTTSGRITTPTSPVKPRYVGDSSSSRNRQIKDRSRSEKQALSKDLLKSLDLDEGHQEVEGVPIPSEEEVTRFRSRMRKSHSAVFNASTGLPTRSSPAPAKRRSGCFDYDSTLTTHRAIKNAVSCSRLVLMSDTPEKDEEYWQHQRTLSTSAPASTQCLLGNFEESMLNGRLEPIGVVQGFTVEIGASGLFCPKHVTLPLTAYFFSLSDDNAPSPYLGHVDLESIGKKGYHVPRVGTVQVTLFNPNGTVVKMFVVRYDLSDMPPVSQTFLRQRTVYTPVDRYWDDSLPSYLRYLIHLRFGSSKSNKIYLHTDVRLIFARGKFEFDPNVASYELRSFTEGPTNPKFSPKR